MSELNARRFSDPHEFTTSVPRRLTIRGELSGAESVELLGTIEGPLSTAGFCHIHVGGSLRGSLTATDVIVEGELVGDIVARGKVELRASARVMADIRAHGIAIADGCYFDGQIHMEGDEERVRFQEKRRNR
jgi:cytoskeletal protein CcmA (bactofilin family)